GIRARSGNHAGAAAVMQLPATAPPVALPLLGGPAQVEIARQWKANVVLTRVEHGGEVASGWSAVAPVPAPDVAEPTTPPPTDHPVSERPPTPGPSEPLLRARVGYALGSYAYQQSPNGDGGPLL